MPRYFFHTVNGHAVPDREGETLAGPQEAQRAALRVMGEILRDGSAQFWEVGELSVLCVDEDDAIVVGLTARRTGPDEAAGLLKELQQP